MLNPKSSALKIVVASSNPVKINAAKESFEKVFGQIYEQEVEVISIDVPSGVPDQPMNTEETRQGALNRVEGAQAFVIQNEIEADFFIAYEGGVDVFEDGPKTFAIICIASKDDMVFGQSAMLPLPIKIYERLLNGVELGSAMDELFKTINIKQKGGAIGQLTKGLETRGSIYQSATVLALSKFVNESLYLA